MMMVKSAMIIPISPYFMEDISTTAVRDEKESFQRRGLVDQRFALEVGENS